MMDLQIEKLHNDFGAKITNLDLGEPFSQNFASQIQSAVDKYSLLYFPAQVINDEQHLKFTRLLGEPEINHVKFGQKGVRDYFYTIGNVQDDGSALPNDHENTIFQTGNNMWHSDSSFREIPAFVTITFACEVPITGGKTDFASCRSAYDRLPAKKQKEIDNLVVIHDYVFSRSKIGQFAVTQSHAASLPPARQKLVRKNSTIDKKNYYIGSHAKEIVGWSFQKSRELLEDLLDRATKPCSIYSHTWKPGDFVIWDNRCLLHRGQGYDANKYRRKMRQTRVKGLNSTLCE